MSYSVFILPRAQSEIRSLPRESSEKLKVAIYALADTARPRGCQKLTGREGWRIRVGNYRVIYEIEDQTQTVTILHVGHRRDIYR